MQVHQALYPVALAAANVSGGWLLLDVLGTRAGALPVAVGALLVLAAVSETVSTAGTGRSRSDGRSGA